jgi:RNA polymerase sigma factor (sigma-70 family)
LRQQQPGQRQHQEPEETSCHSALKLRDKTAEVKQRGIYDLRYTIYESPAIIPVRANRISSIVNLFCRIPPDGGDILLKMSDTDLDLLRQFARDHSQAAFTALVKRHLNLVYSAALRQVRSPQLAEDISQSVFADLARGAGKLSNATGGPPVLTAWLYAVTRRTAIDVIRKESRRQLREQIAVEMNDMNATANSGTGIPPVWADIEACLDDAMAALDETDRSAILLRYFENKSLREVGEALGTNDDAAQKRVSRAVEQLREFFSKRNVTIGASGLAVLISANAVQSAPIGLAATISATAVLAGTAVHTSTVIAATKTIAMTAIQKTLITAALAVVAGAGIYEARQAAQLREQNQILQQQQAPLADQIRQLQRERNDATNRLADVRDEIAKIKNNNLELLKLRGETTVLRNAASQANDPFVQQALTWKANETKLRKLFADHPELRVPELALVSDDQWFSIAKNADLNSETGIRKAESEARHAAKNNFMPDLSGALEKFVKANDDFLPTDLNQLQPYFAQPVDPAILDQYKLTATGKYSNGFVVSDKGVIDQEYDYLWEAGPNGYGPDSLAQETATMTAQMETLKPAIDGFMAANQGKTPTSINQLKSFITTTEQQKAFDELLKSDVRFGQPK